MPRLFTNAIRREPKPWTMPKFGMAMPTDPASLTSLGTDLAGFDWFSHRTYGELRARKQLLIDDTNVEVPFLPITEIRKGGERWYQVYDVFAPGSYAQALEPAKPKAKPKPRPIDALSAFPILDAGQRRDHTNRPAARGAEAILGRLAAHDIAVSLAVDGQRLVVMAPGGRNTGIGELLDVVRPLLVPYLHGGTAYCEVTRHEALTEAQTVAVGGVPWCGRCGAPS